MSAIFLLPLVDVNWLVYAPFDPARDFRVDPPNVDQSIGETRRLQALMREHTGGKYILTPHSGTYCRTGYYEGEMLEVYREAAAEGAELCVHLHEEIKGAGTRYADRAHVTAMFRDCLQRLQSAGIQPVAYRGGHYAYSTFMSELLEEHGIFIDCSCCPDLSQPAREAIWTGAEYSGFYLPEDSRRSAARQRRTRVFEIPIGSDGAGTAYRNLLHVEQSELENLLRVWAAVLERGRRQSRPQIVHVLFHTGSMGRPEWVDRFRRFLDFIPENGGTFVTALEAKSAADRLNCQEAV